MRLPLVALAFLTLASTAPAQDSRVRVVVSDATGQRVPFAIVQQGARAARAANDSGVAILEATAGDSMRLVVRRLGFESAEVWVPSGPGLSESVITLRRIRPLKEYQIRPPEEDRLFRAGFYRRMEEAVRTTSRSVFFTPEVLNRRGATRLTELLRELHFLTISRESVDAGSGGYNRAEIVLGRSRCTANILLDGEVLDGIVEEVRAVEVAATLSSLSADLAAARNHANPTGGPHFTLDQLVSPSVVAGIEVYAVASGAPTELRMRSRRGNCPLIAIWTWPM